MNERSAKLFEGAAVAIKGLNTMGCNSRDLQLGSPMS